MSDKRGLDAFLERYGSEAPEVIWQAALAWLERAAREAREQNGERWRYYPHGEIRRLRGELAGALMLARLAAAFQEEHNAGERELALRARIAADEQRRQERREMTVEAERARLRLAQRDSASREAAS